MSKNCRYILTLSTLLGIMLTCIGLGMLLVVILPWWWFRFILALVLFVSGLCLIFLKK